MEPIDNTFVALAGQVTGVLTVAAVMRPFARLIPGRSLTYWWSAWVILAGSLGLLYLAMRANYAGHWFTPGLIVGFCLTDLLFGFLVWAGCRTLDSADRLRPSEWLWFVPLAAAAVVLPILVPNITRLLQVYPVIAGIPYAAALWAVRPRSDSNGDATTGRWLMRLALFGLIVLYWHYSTAAGLGRYFDLEVATPYQGNWIHLLIIAGLALGMVSLAADRVQAELAHRNEQLATAGAELAKAARTDPLTGLLNRRALSDLSESICGRTGGCVAALDVNDLKPINDKYGHPAGDAALLVLARTLRTLFRVTDPIFRVGGDEFLVILPGGSIAEMTARLSALNDGLTLRLASPDNHRNREEVFTVAWGVVSYAPDKDIWTAIQEADAAMYQTKKKTKSGRIKMPATRALPPT